MKCDIVIKTWKPDLPWLSYCLRFLRKNWKERSSGIVIIANNDCREGMKAMNLNSGGEVAYFRGERVFYVDPWPDTYNFHMYATMLADDFTDAELLLFMDSDLMLVQPASLADFTSNNRPVIYCESTAKMLALAVPAMKVHCQTWYPIMQEFFGIYPTNDFMAVFPMLYWADTLQGVRRMITHKTGRSVEDALYSDKPFRPENFTKHKFTFCDYEIIGMWAHLNDPKRYCFKPLSERAPDKTRLYHSWTQWNNGTQSELEKLLASC
jgi:hypothetical protein